MATIFKSESTKKNLHLARTAETLDVSSAWINLKNDSPCKNSKGYPPSSDNLNRVKVYPTEKQLKKAKIYEFVKIYLTKSGKFNFFIPRILSMFNS